MDALKFLIAYTRMCAAHRACVGCPAYGEPGDLPSPALCNNDYSKLVSTVERWAQDNPADVIVPTEIVRIYTMEITVIDKNPTELTQAELDAAGRAEARCLRGTVDAYDDVVCVKAQQAITKWLEE